MISTSKEFSEEEDRAFLAGWGDYAWPNIPQEEKDKQMQRKLSKGCVAHFLAWLGDTSNDLP